MELIIHAGIQRTGTTSLQSFLSENRTLLLDQSISYPGSKKNHQSTAWEIINGGNGATLLKTLIKNSDGAKKVEKIIISAEDFCRLEDLSFLSKISKKYQIRAIFYLRRQDHWMMSWYNQQIKWPFHRWKSQISKEKFLGCVDHFYWINFSNLLDRWSDAIGKENVTVNIVEKFQTTDVISHFAEFADLDLGGLKNPSVILNDSFPVHLLEIARHLNLFEMPTGQREKVRSAMLRALPSKASNSNTVFSPEERNSVLDHFHESNTEVARKYFDREDLFLEPRPDQSTPYYQHPNLSEQELLRHWIAPIIKTLSE